MRRIGLFLFAASVVALAYSCGDGDLGVVPEPVVNQAPVPVGAIPSQEVPATDSVTIDLSAYFNDPDGDRLAYSASVSNSAIVTASVTAATLSMVAAGKGTALVTVTARDPGGLTATGNVDVTVIGKPGFLHVILQHPESDIGAVVVLVDGPSVDSLTAVPGLVSYHVPVPSGFRAFVAGPLPTGETDSGSPILRFWSEDISESGNYTATVEQAAATTYEQRSIEFARAAVVR